MKLTKDYRGLNLCEPCFNGHHFGLKIGKRVGAEGAEDRSVCKCQENGCECPCSRMAGAQMRETIRKRTAKIAAKKAQMSLLETEAK